MSWSQKIKVMQDWTQPKTLKFLHGFLEIMGYYNKFVHNCGWIAILLSTLIKNNSFILNEVVKHYLSTLKEYICIIHALVVPNLTKTFVLECNASGWVLGAILMQDVHPFTFTSKQLCEIILGKYSYEK